MELAVIGILTAQLTVLAGIFLRLGGMKEAITDIKRRLEHLEKAVFNNGEKL